MKIGKKHSLYVLPICVVCKSTPPKGRREGIYLKNAFICRKCERELLFTGRQGSRYREFLNALKFIWARV